MKELKTITKTYELKNGFRVELQLESGVIRFWLYHKDYGIKMRTYSLILQGNATIEDINIEYELNILSVSGYINAYIDRYANELKKDNENEDEEKNKTLIVDMWYGDKIEDVDNLDVFWYSNDEYRGNVYIKDKCVGDYVITRGTDLCKTFPQLRWDWG